MRGIDFFNWCQDKEVFYIRHDLKRIVLTDISERSRKSNSRNELIYNYVISVGNYKECTRVTLVSCDDHEYSLWFFLRLCKYLKIALTETY